MHTAFRWLVTSSLMLSLTAGVSARTRPHYGGMLRIEVRNANWQDNETVRSLVLESLTAVGALGEAQPSLASQWEQQNGARRWVFKLRGGVQWHDGIPLTAESAVPSLQAAMVGTDLEGSTIHAMGDTIVIENARPIMNLPAELALSRFAVARVDQDIVLGTGAFRMVRVSGSQIVLAANDASWKGRPYLDGIEITTGRAIRDQWLDAGVNRTDIATVPAEMLRHAQQERLRPIVSGNAELIALVSTRTGAGLDIRMRQALAATVDRQALLNFAFQKQGEVAPALLPNWLTGYSALFPTSPDPAHAHELRSQAGQSRPLAIGYEQGDGTLQLVADRIALNAREDGLQAIATANVEPDFVVRRIPLPSGNARVALAEFAAFVQTPITISSDESEELFRIEHELLMHSKLIPLLYVPRAYAIAEKINDATLDDIGRLELDAAWIEEHR